MTKERGVARRGAIGALLVLSDDLPSVVPQLKEKASSLVPEPVVTVPELLSLGLPDPRAAFFSLLFYIIESVYFYFCKILFLIRFVVIHRFPSRFCVLQAAVPSPPRLALRPRCARRKTQCWTSGFSVDATWSSFRIRHLVCLRAC